MSRGLCKGRVIEREFYRTPAEVDAAGGGVDPGVVCDGDVCCGNTELEINKRVSMFT